MVWSVRFKRRVYTIKSEWEIAANFRAKHIQRFVCVSEITFWGKTCCIDITVRHGQNFRNIENVQAYIDDVIVWHETPEKLYECMKKVFERLRYVKVNLDKCQWMVKEIKYLGHILTRYGIKPNTEKIKAIVEALAPQNVTQLKSFVGMVMYYNKFLKNLNVILAPMYILLKKEQKWVWSENCIKAFEACKKELCEKHILTHYVGISILLCQMIKKSLSHVCGQWQLV